MTLQAAPSFILSLLPQGTPVAALVLNQGQATSLSNAAKEDSYGAFQSAATSFCEATKGLEQGKYGWATVKLYYSCFYLKKSKVLRQGICTLYIGNSPYSIKAAVGQSLVKKSGNSHTVVQNEYKSAFPNGTFSSQPIEDKSPIDWMATNREEINYRRQKWQDPLPPRWFDIISAHGLRRAVLDYIGDPSVMAFDPAHAALALPILAFFEEKSFYKSLNFDPLSLDERNHILSMCSDKSGPISQLHSLFNFS